MDKNPKVRAVGLHYRSQINRPETPEKRGSQQIFRPNYKRPNAILSHISNHAKMDHMIIESVGLGPYIDHNKIIKIKRQLKRGEYPISCAKIALFMLDDAQNIT
jgi:anti-sigma28 factor (negative regulator of flagellin synthesis)